MAPDAEEEEEVAYARRPDHDGKPNPRRIGSDTMLDAKRKRGLG